MSRRLPSPHQEVRGEIRVWREDGDCVIAYHGPEDALLAAGVATPDMLEPRTNNDRTKPKFDSDGDRYTRCSQRKVLVVASGEETVVRYFKLLRFKSRERAKLLPGVAEWVSTDERECADDQSRPTSRPSTDNRAHFLKRDRFIGRFQRHAQWAVQDWLIVPNWSLLKAEIAAARVLRK